MKTITEFTGIHIKNTSKLKADLTAAGKTPEELSPAIAETLKLEGEKLSHLLNAVETVGPRIDDLKRVLVLTPASETETAPAGSQKHGDHFYLPEYYPPVAGKGKPAGKDAEGRGGKRDGKGRGGKGRGGRGERGGENRGAGPGKGGEAGGGGRGPRRDRAPRDQAQAGVPVKITPKGEAATITPRPPSGPTPNQS